MENSSSCVEERAGLEGRFFHSPSVFQLSFDPGPGAGRVDQQTLLWLVCVWERPSNSEVHQQE